MIPSRVFQLAAVATFCFCRGAVGGPAHPIVEVKTGYVIGAPSKGKWIDGVHAAKTLQAGTSFRVYGLQSEKGTATGSKPASVDEPCPETQMISLSPEIDGGVIALAAPWNALPRKPKITDTTQPVYVQAVRDFLTIHGLKEAKVVITQILRIDLEGDGEEEVLISATNYSAKENDIPSNAPEGSYSFVLLRRVVSGKVTTRLVAGEVYPKGKEFSAPNRYRVLAVLDLDGDGKLEVIVHSAYYEGAATTIYRCTLANVEELVSAGCGA